MKPCERGSISIYLLLVALLLALLAQLGFLCCRQMLEKSRQGLLKQQLRRLNNSYFLKLKDAELTPGDYLCFEGVLRPGQEVVAVKATSSQSSDGLINFLEVKGTAPNVNGAVQGLCQLTLQFSEPQRLLAEQYALVSKTATGLEYLAQEVVYKQASTEEVKLPEVRFFYNKAASNTTANILVSEGFTRRFTYLDWESSFVFSKQVRLIGATVFVNKAGIEIGSGASFPDRIAMYSQKGNITIGDNVRMDKALLHAYGTITIGTGCKIKGLIIANKIILKGASEFSADADVVAPFVSCAFMK
ncbi:MAG: hypothetical protein MSQ83_05605 [Phascolarctobacterium sp.]|nr:hypothetical protein [Phascolarctobacterium sp.]